MDGQRQYPGEPERWYGDQADEDPGRVPGQRGAEPSRGTDPQRYPESDRYAYGDAPQYTETAYPDQPGFAAEAGYAEPQRYADPAYDEPPAYPGGMESSRRRAPARTRRVGKRSGMELPEPEGADARAAETRAAEAHRAEPEPGEEPQHYRAERLDRSALRRPSDGQPGVSGDTFGGQPDAEALPPAGYVPLQGPTQTLPTSAPPAAVYLSKRPGIAAAIWIVTIIAELLLVKVLLKAEFGHPMIASVALGSLLAMIGAPLTAVGLYGLTVGAATASGPNSGRAWLRTPLAYLPVGLILVVAAAIAS